MNRPILFCFGLILTALVGCNNPKQPSVEESIAKAVHVEDPEKQALIALKNRQRVERQEHAAEQAQRDQARAAEIDAAAVLPDVVPARIEDACDAAVDAYDAFMKVGPEKDALLWYQGRRKKMGERRATCVTQANPTVAACQSKALLMPLATLAELERAEAANLVFARCADKFAPSGP